MLAEFRAAIVKQLADHPIDHDGSPVEVWPTVPDDVNALPCIVVGYPEASPARETGVFDRSLTLYAIARRVDAGDPESEVIALADSLWTVLGGSGGIKVRTVPTGPYERIGIENLEHRIVTIAGVDHDAYLFTLTSPTATC